MDDKFDVMWQNLINQPDRCIHNEPRDLNGAIKIAVYNYTGLCIYVIM